MFDGRFSTCPLWLSCLVAHSKALKLLLRSLAVLPPQTTDFGTPMGNGIATHWGEEEQSVSSFKFRLFVCSTLALCRHWVITRMSTDEQAGLRERLASYPVEPFNKYTNVYPYYVMFAKGDVKVRVPIALDANAYRCIQENPLPFLEKLRDQLSSKFSETSSEKTAIMPKLDTKKSYILVSDTPRKDVAFDNPNKISIVNSIFNEMVNLRKEFKRIRCFYGLTYGDVAQSILDCYKVDQSAYMLYRLERCSLTAWKHSQVLTLIRRWMMDMKTPKQRARLFPPWKLKRFLSLRYEKLSAKSVTFTKDQQEELERFYTKMKKPSNEDLRELKQQLGFTTLECCISSGIKTTRSV
ncbi:hypothetical protein TcWFU_003812 [Taenia crassiceps]|uniref:POU-specific domain-containing protein n=1 Tax=Taenia crassiceps TaxID=6207 RepID=A0ABR4QPV0_9CEST